MSCNPIGCSATTIAGSATCRQGRALISRRLRDCIRRLGRDLSENLILTVDRVWLQLTFSVAGATDYSVLRTASN